MAKSAVALRHVHFEDVGTFAVPLEAAGYCLSYLDAGMTDLEGFDPMAPDLLVVLGGPIGVYETGAYPMLELEITAISRRLAAAGPTLGICLGAQLMAAALGAPVAPMGHKEIGFGALQLTEAGREGPLRHLDGVEVLHWHGDAFGIPSGAVNLAQTALCATQAFSAGDTVLGLQFHAEADATRGMEPWLIGHAAELATAGFDVRKIRADAVRCAAALKTAGERLFSAWLAGL